MPSNQTIRYYLFIQIVGCCYGHRGKIGELHFCRIAALNISKMYFYFQKKSDFKIVKT
jgi:hypothetical protein